MKAFLPKLSEYWQWIATIFAITFALLAFGGKVKAVANMPPKVDSLTAYLQKLDATEDKRFCMEVAQLQHTDWTKCLLGDVTDPK